VQRKTLGKFMQGEDLGAMIAPQQHNSLFKAETLFASGNLFEVGNGSRDFVAEETDRDAALGFPPDLNVKVHLVSDLCLRCRGRVQLCSVGHLVTTIYTVSIAK
jgi:hypothetical protein